MKTAKEAVERGLKQAAEGKTKSLGSFAQYADESNKVTKVIALWGGPGTGKSTAAASLYAKLKNNNINAELVREYVKSWAWEGRKIEPMDQWYFMGQQVRAESLLFNKVDVIVTDSPWLMQSFYGEKYLNTDLFTRAMDLIIEHTKQVYPGVKTKHYLLIREKPYNPAGRYGSEKSSRQTDVEIEEFLNRKNIDYVKCTATEMEQLEGAANDDPQTCS